MSFKPKPTDFSPTLFKNPKGLKLIGRGGLEGLPSRIAIKNGVKTTRSGLVPEADSKGLLPLIEEAELPERSIEAI